MVQPVEVLAGLARLGGGQLQRLLAFPPARGSRRAAARPRRGCAARSPDPAPPSPSPTSPWPVPRHCRWHRPAAFARTAPGARRPQSRPHGSNPGAARNRRTGAARPAHRGGTQPAAAAPTTWALPRQNTGCVWAVRLKTSTNNKAWLIFAAERERQSDTPTEPTRFDQQTPEQQVGQGIKPGQPEKRLGFEQGQARQPIAQKTAVQPARFRQRRRHQRVNPDTKTKQQASEQQASESAGSVAATPGHARACQGMPATIAGTN